MQNSHLQIGNDVWIGANAVIRSDVTIGDGAVIGAGSVVTKNVDPYSIVGGVPARVIRQRFDDKLIERLMQSRWWEFDARSLEGIPVTEPADALNIIAEREAQGLIRRRPPEFKTATLHKGGFTLQAP